MRTKHAPNFWTNINFSVPLDIEILREETLEDIHVSWLRYSSHEHDSLTIRVYAIYGRSTAVDKPIPGLLHIHGGTQTASLDEVLFFAKRGYAVLSFDWTGPTDQRTEDVTTQFPTAVGSNNNGPDMKNGKVWHIVTMARRAVFLLSQRPEVDAERLGVYGISWGGFSTWLVNAMEPRLKAAVALYGIGTSLEDAAAGWHAELLPAHYAGRQKSPIAFLNGTNDFFGQIPVMQEVMPKVSAENRLSLVPNENHGLDALTKETGYRWLDHYLKNTPELAPAPELSVREQDGHLIASVYAPKATSCTLSFACGDKPFNSLHWNLCEMSPIENSLFEVTAPAPSQFQTIRCLAGAVYPENYRLSTLMETFAPTDAPAKNETCNRTDRLFTPAEGVNAWYQSWPGGAVMFTPNDWRLDIAPSLIDERFCLVAHCQKKEQTPLIVYLRSPSDPRRAANDATGISIELNTTGIKSFTVSAFLSDAVGDGTQALPFSCSYTLFGESNWTCITVKKDDLRDKDNTPLIDLTAIHELSITIEVESGSSPEIGEIRWMR